jgi:signal peptide peptidase SppA
MKVSLFNHELFALMRAKLDELVGLDAALVASSLAARQELPEIKAATAPADGGGVIAVIPMYGVISQRADIFTMLFGGVPLTKLQAVLRSNVADINVKGIVLDVASPGGTVSGVPELAQEIREMRQQKPIVAVANSLAASAAYYLAAAASEVVSTPSGLVGSVGVYTIHEDWSGAYEQAGVKRTVVAAGDAKIAEDAPLTDEALAALQAIVEYAYNNFVSDVAAGRGTSADDVRANYGKGAVLAAKPALKAGMIDRIATVEEVVRLLSSPSGRRSVMGQPAGDAGEADRRIRAMEADIFE